MGRRRGFWAQLEYEAEQRRKAAERQRREEQRLWQQDLRRQAAQQGAAAREAAATERERRLLVEQRRRTEAEQQTAAVNRRIRQLDTLLTSELARPTAIDLMRLKRQVDLPPFDPGRFGTPPPGPRWEDFAPAPPGWLGKLFGGEQRYEQARTDAQAQFDEASATHAQAEEDWQRRLHDAEQEHAAKLAADAEEVEQHNAEVDRFEEQLRAGDREAVEAYFEQVLRASVYPEGFPNDCRVAYQPEPRRLVIERELPGRNVVPEHLEYKYIRTRDAIEPRGRPPREMQQRYEAIVSRVALRTLREIFAAGWEPLVEAVVFNGHVSRKNPGTGQPERPCILSVAPTREKFEELVLADLKPRECLRHLNALVSPHPYDLEPVPPVLDFDLTRYRITHEEVDAIAALDSRKDLLKITPTEFEHLIRELFEKMGMEAWVTRASRDDGVDAVATNPDPIVGGLCIIQAKRYSGVVSTESVRALAGVMEDKRAGKGIMVTTSWFGPESWDFRARNGRIELIEGVHLKDLLKRYLDRDVLISLPKQPPKRKRPTSIQERRSSQADR